MGYTFTSDDIIVNMTFFKARSFAVMVDKIANLSNGNHSFIKLQNPRHHNIKVETKFCVIDAFLVQRIPNFHNCIPKS